MDITYEGVSQGWEKFYFRADGDRPVLEILIPGNDRIYVASVKDGDPVVYETMGMVHRHTDEALEAAGIDTQYICLGSVKSYVVPRIATLMARVYCPSTPVKTQ